VAAVYDLRIEPGGVRSELQVLFHGIAWNKRNLEAGNRWADRGGAARARSGTPLQRVNIVFMGMGDPS